MSRHTAQLERMKSRSSFRASFHPLPVPAAFRKHVAIDFVFGFPKYVHKNNDVLAFDDHLSKMYHLAYVAMLMTAENCARYFINTIS